MNLLDIANQYKDGVETLKDWLGSGGEVVSHDEAERRSLVCLTCPQNLSPRWWERFLTDPIAIAIRKQLEIKNHAQLRVINEEDMHVCRACGCCIPAKLWTPIEHIKAHTSMETLSKAPAHCWWRRAIMESP